MNIYDFAGNEWEWTLEHATYDSNYPCSYRGGSYYNTGSEAPCSYRNNYNPTYNNISFRALLF